MLAGVHGLDAVMFVVAAMKRDAADAGALETSTCSRCGVALVR